MKNKIITATKKQMSELTSEIISVVIYSVVIPLAVLWVLKTACMHAYNFAKTLWVNGKSNEWILIMNSGEMVKAGVGLRCFKGPFD